MCIILYLVPHAMHLACLSVHTSCMFIHPCHTSCMFIHPCRVCCLSTHAMHLTCLPMPRILNCMFTHTVYVTCLSMQCIASLFIQAIHPACYLTFQPCNAQEKSFWYSWLKGELTWCVLMITKCSQCTNSKFSRLYKYQIYPNALC